MEEEKKEIVKEDTKKEEKRKVKKEKGKFCEKIISKAKKIRKKTLAIATIVLGVLLIALVASLLINTLKISEKSAERITLNFLNGYIVPDKSITIDSVEYNSDLGIYSVNIIYKNSPGIVALSSDGKYIDFGSGLINIKSYIKSVESTTSEPTTNVPKSDAEKDNCSANIATTTGFDIEAIEELAFSAEGITMLKEQEAISTKYGVSGSPTLIINGVKSSAIYSGTDTTKAAICSAFTAKPSECNGVTTNSSWTAKSAKPVVELFVMSYCPYGVRAEENIAPLQELFGSKIDLKIRYIINVNGETIDKVNSLHGITEAKEDARQLAIAKLYPNKLWDYLAEFNRVCYGGGAASSGSC